MLLFGSFTLAACDSGDDNTIDVDVVIGTYSFTRWNFAPLAAAIADANVLDTLVTAQTSLRFTTDKRFLLNYQFQGNPNPLFISGTFAVNGQAVDLAIDGSFDAARRKLILPRNFSLDVVDNGTRLEGNIDRNGVTLTEFSSRYVGVPSLDGTLQLRLSKR